MKSCQRTREFLLKCGDSPLTTLTALIFVVLTIVSLSGIDELVVGGFFAIVFVLIFLFVTKRVKRRNAS
jgi:uncharacterized membrane protein